MPNKIKQFHITKKNIFELLVVLELFNIFYFVEEIQIFIIGEKIWNNTMILT